jgi:hypothetical protein
MSTFWRRFLLVLGLIALGGGCNPLYLPFFLASGEPKFPPSYRRLATDDKKQQVRVAILTYMGVPEGEEVFRADRDLARSVAKELQTLCKYNEENVAVIDPFKVEEYTNERPDWHHQHLDLEKVGKDLKADYVIYIEINSLAFYQPGTYRQFYQGKANLTLSLVNVRKPNDISSGPRELAFSYPSESRGGNVPVDSDTPPQVFRQKFLDYLGRQMAWQFTAHPTNQHHWTE